MTDETFKQQIFSAFDIAPSLYDLLFGCSVEYSVLVLRYIITAFILLSDERNLVEKPCIYALAHFEPIDSFPLLSGGFFNLNNLAFMDARFTYRRKFIHKGGDKSGEINNDKRDNTIQM
ncbi:hypothetical protein ACFLT2_03390 [Acidobacteriota bacterium]